MAETTPRSLCSLTLLFQGLQMRSSNLGPDAQFTWPAANRAIYQPFTLPWSYTVARIGWYNGGTLSGNVSVGIYAVGTSITSLYLSGAITQTPINAQNHILGTPLVLPGGHYMLGLSSSSATATIQGTGCSADQGRYLGLLQQDTAHPLPATVTPAAFSGAFWPVMGISRTTS